MSFHRNAKLGLAGRHALVCAIGGGMSLAPRPATAHRWCHRWLDASEEARATLACLFDRSSRPHRSPRQLAPQLAEAICECRRRTGGDHGLSLARPAAHTRPWLKRAGLSRPPRPVKEPANSYEWPCPGDLLHMDVCSYARFLRPGHRVTGDRSQARRGRSVETPVGYDYAHAIVDDHSRLAYVELHDDEKAATVTGFVERALTHFAEHGVVAKRVMTDNAFAYVKNRSLRELLARRDIRHLTTRPYRPRTNGKVERFHQTMAREWAYGLSYCSHRHRNRALPHWLEHYNTRRPHSSLGIGHLSAAFTTSVGRTTSC